jgi:tRNA nucleotidyltransferase (CCA-adding enzyme)
VKKSSWRRSVCSAGAVCGASSARNSTSGFDTSPGSSVSKATAIPAAQARIATSASTSSRHVRRRRANIKAMVPVPSEQLLASLEALPAGRRLLGVVERPDAEAVRGGRRAPRHDGPLEGVFLVGGAVRDLLLGRTPRELDLVVEGDGHAVADELRRRLGGFGRVHERFGTATIETADGMSVDVAGARAETYARPGALPDVRPGTVADDMARRDFTVNAIAVGVSPDRRGETHAFPGAVEDLEAGVLRVLHDGSFVDDPTRLLRLVRYAARLGFAIEPATERLARAAFAAGAPETAGVARVGNELMLLLGETPAVAGLELLAELGGAGDLVVEPDLLARALRLRPDDARQELLLLAACAREVEPRRLKAWLAGMHVQGAYAVQDAARDPEGLAAAMRAAERPSALAGAVRGRTPEAIALAGALGAEDAARRWLNELRFVRLRIGGTDLMAAGVPQGPEIGRRLAAALARKLDEGLATPEEELAAALAA